MPARCGCGSDRCRRAPRARIWPARRPSSVPHGPAARASVPAAPVAGCSWRPGGARTGRQPATSTAGWRSRRWRWPMRPATGRTPIGSSPPGTSPGGSAAPSSMTSARCSSTAAPCSARRGRSRARRGTARCSAGRRRPTSTRPSTSTTTIWSTPAGRPTLPSPCRSTTPSGVYCFRVTGPDGSVDRTPFVVRPPDGTATADVLFLLPTATYLAYANHRMTIDGSDFFPARSRLRPEFQYLRDHPEVGLSMYEYHADGSGVMYSSRRRPVLNLRPGADGWAFTADTNLVAFLERWGRFDVATDEDLHREGAALLDRYRVVVTGSHPEYFSTAMLDALEAFLRHGGRLMYLGGNGFYWRVAFHPEQPGVMEVRRAEDGTRGWIAEPGEYYHEWGGEYGGLWRRLGRPPNQLVGVGFAAQGFDRAAPYRRTPASFDRPGGVDLRRGGGRRRVRRLRRRAGRGRPGDRPLRRAPRLAPPRRRARLQRRALSRDAAHQGGAAGDPARHGRSPDPGRHGVLRDAGRRCGVLCRLDRLVRRARPPRGRQRHQPDHHQRARPLRRPRAVPVRRLGRGRERSAAQPVPASAQSCAAAAARRSSTPASTATSARSRSWSSVAEATGCSITTKR